jgi:nucleolar GTP-binding protein
VLQLESRLKKRNNIARKPRTDKKMSLSQMRSQLRNVGLELGANADSSASAPLDDSMTGTASASASSVALPAHLRAARERSRGRSVSKRRDRAVKRALADPIDVDNEEAAAGGKGKKRQRLDRSVSARPGARSVSRAHDAALTRSQSRATSGLRDQQMDQKAQRLQKKSQRHHLELSKVAARAGEGDRRIFVKMPKHLFSGKRGIGKTDRR